MQTNSALLMLEPCKRTKLKFQKQLPGSKKKEKEEKTHQQKWYTVIVQSYNEEKKKEVV